MADQTIAREPTPAEAKIIAESGEFFEFTAAAELKQRKEESEDLLFDLGGEHQWPEAIRAERKGIAGVVAARPMLTINKLRQPCRQVVNQARLSRFGIKVSPIGTAKKQTAEIRQGMIRQIEVASNAQQARIWAFTRAVKAGRGFYRVTNKYANDKDHQLDLSIDRILNQASVYLDPTATMADWSDMKRALITEDLTPEQYKKAYPRTELASADTLTAIGDAQSGWIFAVPGGQIIRVAEYFWVEETMRAVALLGDGRNVDEKAVTRKDKVINRREIPDRTVMWAKRNGTQIIKGPTRWPGRYIPIIPVLGDEIYLDGDRYFEGIIRQARDPQRSYNYMRSAQVEVIGLGSRAPWVVDPEQIKGYEHLWNTANVRNHAYLPRKRYAPDGKDYGEVYHQALEPAIQAITLAAHEADADIHAATGFEEPALGKISKRERSGKAIESLVAQGERGSFNFLDNLGIAITQEARILNDLLGPTYNEPGRVMRILGKDDNARSVMLNIPFVKDQDGQPQAAPMDPTTGKPTMPEGAQPGADIEHYDLSTGEFDVVVTVGKSTATENEEAATVIEGIMESAPQLTPLMADIYVRRRDFPGSDEMADRLKKALPPQFQGEEDGAPKIPPQVQAQIQQADQMLQLLQKELDAKTDLIEKETLKYEHEKNINDAKLASSEKIAGLKLDVEVLKLRFEIEKVTVSAQTAMAKIQSGNDIAGAQAELQLLTQRLSELHDMSLVKEQGAQQEAADVRAGNQAAEADARQGTMAAEADSRAVAGDKERIATQAAVLPKPAPRGP